jgi:arylsulfatase A-like enzyme
MSYRRQRKGLFRAGNGLLLLAVVVLCGCESQQPAPALFLRQRLLHSPAYLDSLPRDPFNGLIRQGVVEESVNPVLAGAYKVSLTEHRADGRCDIMPAVLLRGKATLHIPAVEVAHGDVVAFYIGSLPQRLWRNPIFTWPRLLLTAQAEDGAKAVWTIQHNPATPNQWTQQRVDLSRFAGKQVRLDVRVIGLSFTAADHIVVGDVGLYNTTQQNHRPNVVLIWLDKVQASLLEQSGGPAGWLPRLNALAKESIAFTNARSAGNHTTMSVLQTYFSFLNTAPYLNLATIQFPNLSSQLAGAGWYSASLGINTSSTAHLPEWGTGQIDVSHDRAVADLRISDGFDDGFLFRTQVEPWLRRERREPFLLNIHYQGGHEELDRYPDSYNQLYGQQALTLAHGDPIEAKYFLKVRFADEVLGKTIDLLKELGLWEHSVVVVLADHGTTLGSDHRFFQRGYPRMVRVSHPTAFYEDQVRIPLLMHVPGAAQVVIREAISLLDLAPTLLDLVGLPIPQQFEGRSFAAAVRGVATPDPTPLFFVCEEEGLYGVLDFPYKYVWYQDQVERWSLRPDWVAGDDWYWIPKDSNQRELFDQFLAPFVKAGVVMGPIFVKQELFNLADDPHEQHNVADIENAHAEKMLAVLKKHFPAVSGDEIDLNRIVLEMLSPKPAVFGGTVASDAPLKPEYIDGCDLLFRDCHRTTFRCESTATMSSRLSFFKTKGHSIRLEMSKDSQPLDPSDLFFGEFGLPVRLAPAVGWELADSMLPVPAERAPPIVPGRDAGVFLYRQLPVSNGAEMTPEIARVFAQWGYGK